MAASDPVQKSSAQTGSPGSTAAAWAVELGAHQVHVSIDAAGDHQQAAGVDLPRAGHGPAELGDPAAGDAHVGLLPVTGRHDRAITHNQIKALLCHPGILARRCRQCRWPGPVCGPFGRAADGLAPPRDTG